MRVLQITKYYSPHIGSIETAVKTLVDTIKDYADISVLSCQEKGLAVSDIIDDTIITRSNTITDIHDEPISFGFINDFKDFSKRADIVHIHLPFPLASLAFFLSKFKGKIVISWYYDTKSILLKPLVWSLLSKAHCIIAPSQKLIDTSEFLGDFRDKCKVVPLSVNIEKYEKTDTYPLLTEKLRYPHNKKILFVGRLTASKGIEVLLSAFKHINGGELFIVGQGNLLNDLKVYSEINKMGEKIHFLGILDDEDLYSAYADCDFSVFPSVSDENFGIVQLEAMVFGKPVINTDLPTGVAEISLDKLTGITVPVNDVLALAGAMQKLINDEELVRLMGLNSYKRVRQLYSAEKNMKEIFDVYCSLISGIEIAPAEKQKRIIN
ncbi:MAG: glycosyltransferase [Oscillospiraceae bacterium]|jgi:rhamnosyl/mannosyltransferase|nr:glycosyltransferase [Oscillospiraceae bacterium]